MSTRIHQIKLPAELEQKLRERAADAGTDADTFIIRAIEEKLQTPKSFKELFAPLHEAFAHADESPDSLNQTFQQLIDSARKSRRAKAS
jgi:hypothetical protein